MWISMILLSAILFLFLCLINLRLSFLIILALLPSYLIRFNIFSIPVTFLEMMIIILFFIFVISNLPKAGEKSLRHDKSTYKGSLALLGTTKYFAVLILLFILSATLSIFISPDLRAAAGIWKAYFIEPIILLLIGLNLFRPAKTAATAGGGTEGALNSKNIIFALSVSALLVGIFAIYQKFTGFMAPYTFWGKGGVFRVTSFYGFPNAIGLFLAPLIPLFINGLVSGSRITRPTVPVRNGREFGMTEKWHGMTGLFYILIIILSIISIYFAHSTGALVALFSGLLITGLFFKKTKIFSIIILIIFFLLFSLNFIPQKIQDELLLKDWSGFVRKVGWQESLEMLKNNFIFGAGLSGYPEVFAEYHKIDFIEIFQYPHNIILNFWSEIGLFGLLIFILLIIYYYARIIKSKGNIWLKFALFWSMMVILIHGLVDAPYFKNDLAILFWVLFLLVLLNYETSKNTT